MTATALTVRAASMPDILHILGLINSYTANGVMLPRTEFEMAENLRDFSCAYDGDTLLGCAALHFYTPQALRCARLRSGPKRRSGA